MRGFGTPGVLFGTTAISTMNKMTARPSRYFAPIDDMGKWHAAWTIDWTTRCGANVIVNPSLEIAVEGNVDTTTVHPIVCRRCLNYATSSKYDTEWIFQ